jgi:2-polyprenyl-3-methyl-5-hydroxy-6-metoxy-1,4-benzoquinol methylase
LLKETRAAIHATDLSEALVQETRVRLGDSSRVTYDQLDIYQLDPKQHARETVVCCEVLEHLEHPDLGLRAIARSTKDYAVLSVPREPNFRVLNFLRGQHFTDLGNAPGHVQHWSSTAFVRFVEQEFEILELRALLPWTVIRARPRRKA